MRVPEEPVCIHHFWQNLIFTSLHLKSPVHVVPVSVQNPGGGWARDPGGDLLPPLLDQDPDYDPAHQAQLKKGRWSQVSDISQSDSKFILFSPIIEVMSILFFNSTWTNTLQKMF
jgi:hypothetical protein